MVKKYGGKIAETARGTRSADCLVHGEIFGGKETTEKIKTARELGIPIINESDFFKLVDREGRTPTAP